MKTFDANNIVENYTSTQIKKYIPARISQAVWYSSCMMFMRMVRCDSISGSSPLSKFFFRIVISLPFCESSHIWSAADFCDTRSLQASNLSFVSINTAEKAAPSGNSLNSKPMKELVKQLYYWLLTTDYYFAQLAITPSNRSEKKKLYKDTGLEEGQKRIRLGYRLEKITLDGLYSGSNLKIFSPAF